MLLKKELTIQDKFKSPTIKFTKDIYFLEQKFKIKRIQNQTFFLKFVFVFLIL